MDDYGPATYGERVADVYDEWYDEANPYECELLAELAAGGRVLELGTKALTDIEFGLAVLSTEDRDQVYAALRTVRSSDFL